MRLVKTKMPQPGAGPVTASKTCKSVAAAVSRAVARLTEMELIDAVPSPTDPRKRSLSLNAAGYDLHDRILEAALQREAVLIDGVDPDDLNAFLRVMRLLHRNVQRL